MFCLITLLVTFQWQPSLPPFPLGHNFDRLINELKLMQHLEICLPSELPTTEAYFSFQLTFKIPCSPPTNTKWTTTAVEFLFLFFKTEFEFGFSWKKVSKKDSLMTAFVTVHSGSFRGLRKISSSISHLLNIRILPPPLQNEIQLLSRLFCYSKLVRLFGLDWGRLRRGIQVELAGSRVQETFRASLTRFQELHPRRAIKPE